MSARDFQHLGDDTVYDGYIWKVVVGRFAGPDGLEFSRDIVRSPGAVAVVAIDESDHVVLLRHYRPTFDGEVIEIPAGMRDVPDEEPISTARRELREEAGLEAESWQLLHVFLPAPGMTDSTVHVYEARGLRSVEREPHGPEESDMELFRAPLSEALSMVSDGRIQDAKTVIGILLATLRTSG